MGRRTKDEDNKYCVLIIIYSSKILQKCQIKVTEMENLRVVLKIRLKHLPQILSTNKSVERSSHFLICL